jgi:peptide-methionine (S)-S-oxide reductase
MKPADTQSSHSEDAWNSRTPLATMRGVVSCQANSSCDRGANISRSTAWRPEANPASSRRGRYTGGDVLNATYRNHGTHAEAIEIVFDPEQTSYRELLEFFFQIHDPTTLNRQGNDIGTSYRSAIFYLDEQQRRVAEETIADVDTSGCWPGEVVTEVTPAGPFWEAEPEHQNYLERNPYGYTCHFVRPDWVLAERTKTTAG